MSNIAPIRGKANYTIRNLGTGGKLLRFSKSNFRVPLSPNNREFLNFAQGLRPFRKGSRRLAYTLYGSEIYIGKNHMHINNKYSAFDNFDITSTIRSSKQPTIVLGWTCVYPMPFTSRRKDKELGIGKKQREVLFVDGVSDLFKSLQKKLVPADYASQQMKTLKFFPWLLRKQKIDMPIILLEEIPPATGLRVANLSNKNAWKLVEKGIRLEI